VASGTIETAILSPTQENLDRLSDWIRQGGVAALPTETVYGLVADASNTGALRQVFEIKGRPLSNPLIVHVENGEKLLEWAELTGDLRRTVLTLVEKFSPGPLSYVLPKKFWVPELLTAGRPTLALRIPAHPLFREILRRSKCALAAPSANPFGYLSPTSARHVQESLGGKLRYVLDGGECPIGLESTILDLSRSPMRLLRPGKISLEEIQSVLPDKEILLPEEERALANEEIALAEKERAGHIPGEADEFASPGAPGGPRRHYSLRTPLHLFFKTEELLLAKEEKVARVFLSRKDREEVFRNDFFLSEEGDGAQMAQRLFGLLWELDTSRSYEKIYCQCPPSHGLGAAIANRLRRAAGRLKHGP
jgi:L-threonylcarbamoyladenylate synthase